MKGNDQDPEKASASILPFFLFLFLFFKINMNAFVGALYCLRHWVPQTPYFARIESSIYLGDLFVMHEIHTKISYPTIPYAS